MTDGTIGHDPKGEWDMGFWAQNEPRICSYCGGTFTVTDKRSKDRDYCFKQSCISKHYRDLVRRKQETIDSGYTEASRKNAEQDTRLRDMDLELERLRDELSGAQADLIEMATGFRAMFDSGLLAIDSDSPEYEHRDRYQRAVTLMNEHCRQRHRTEEEIREHEARLAELDRQWEQARAARDLTELERISKTRHRIVADFDRTHPEQWAERQIAQLKRDWVQEHPGELLVDETQEMIQYRVEARRRRMLLDQKAKGEGNR